MREEGQARDSILKKLRQRPELKRHCLVPIGEYVVPLIGIGPAEGIEQCDRCESWFALWEVEWDGQRMLCAGCQQEVKNYIAPIC